MKRLAGALIAMALAAATALSGMPATGSTALPTMVSWDPVNYTPNVENDAVVDHADVLGLAKIGSTIYAGGDIHLVSDAARSRQYIRHNIMAFGATSGEMQSFAPMVNATVWAVEPSEDRRWLYIGGDFTHVNGVPRRGVAKINATTGALAPGFDARLSRGGVTQIRLVNGRLIVGGSFPDQLLALNPNTGRDTGYIDLSITGRVAPNSGATDVYRFAVTPSGLRLLAIGNFTAVDGRERTRAFMVNLGPSHAVLNGWYYPPLSRMCRVESLPAYLRDVDFSPNGSWFVIAASGGEPATRRGIGRDVCDGAARFETKVLDPARPTWINYTGGDTLHSVAVAGAAVYVQGHNRWLDNPFGRNNAGPGAVNREGIGAINSSTGKARRWNPGKTRAVGGKDFLVTRSGLWVGSDGTRFNGEYRRGLAFLPL